MCTYTSSYNIYLLAFFFFISLLTGESTLRNYTSVLPTTQGFQQHVLESLRDQAAEVEHPFVVIMHDEVSIQKDLVYDFKSGQLVGYVCQEELQQEKVFIIVAS